MSDSDDAGRVAYELLRTHGDVRKAETHEAIVRALSCVKDDRHGAEVLQRHHATEYAFVRGQELREVSARRSQLRDKWRRRQKSEVPEEGATIEDVRQRFPKLFEGVVEERTEHEKLNAAAHRVLAPKKVSVHAASTSVGAGSDSVVPLSNVRTRAGSGNNDVNFLDDNIANGPSETSVFSMPRNAASRPERGLSELLSKRSRLPHEDLEPFGDGARPKLLPQRSPFQTASEQLQRDRSTRNVDDDEPRSRNRGRRDDVRGPPRGAYHPVNHNLLFGGGANGDNDGYISGSSAVSKKFVSPMNNNGTNKSVKQAVSPHEDENMDPRLKSCDPELIEKIEMEIVDNGDPVTFDDIAGLQFAKKCVNELVIWPMQRPDIFTGLRSLPKGLLLFGPPGTGKTLIGKAIASQCNATFFNISASSLTSKWIGQGEKLVRTLFAVAAVKQPSVIFIDEIDSLLTQRSSEDNEASRRMKTEFLVQLDGAGTKAKDIILVVGATNRPQELDEAARRRFVKRLYIPLPSLEARLDMISRLLKNNQNDLTGENLAFIAESTKGYSGADVRALCTEAAMGPIRNCADIRTMDADSVRPINSDDFKDALRGVRSSVAARDLAFYKEWNDEFGSFAFESHEAS
ncbi:unnamed protein product [Hyaloperonospora brassicae]|uniref:AAA+ ATPase domain-containing protein n=1 Tax=Hyaloperonospora brassicae TaxID=162125 RepID=A0AAV0TYY5_HYABA|nr:unnamed protein product [Hyaloperonospora brassicae]